MFFSSHSLVEVQLRLFTSHRDNSSRQQLTIGRRKNSQKRSVKGLSPRRKSWRKKTERTRISSSFGPFCFFLIIFSSSSIKLWLPGETAPPEAARSALHRSRLSMHNSHRDTRLERIDLYRSSSRGSALAFACLSCTPQGGAD